MGGRSGSDLHVTPIEVNTYMRGARVHSVEFKDGYATAEIRVYLAPRDSVPN